MPHPDTHQLINAWLEYHDIQPSSVSKTHGGGWLTITDVLVSQANQLLGASYQLYRNLNTSDTTIRTVSYALPAVLHKHIQMVAPTTYFPSKRMNPQTPLKRSLEAAPAQAQSRSGNLATALASRADEVWPVWLYWLYGTEEYVPTATAQNTLAVLGLQDQFPSPQDFALLTEMYREIPTTFTVRYVNGGANNPNNPSKQANVDTQYAQAMAFSTPLIFYNIGGDLADDAFLPWFAIVLDPTEPHISPTISISYGDYEPNVPEEYAQVVCHLFMRLGSRGVTVLVASGSEGVGPKNCKDDDGNTKFVPEFPSSCACGVLSPFTITRQGQV